MCKWRHLIENFLGKLKEFKHIALRAGKTDEGIVTFAHCTYLSGRGVVSRAEEIDNLEFWARN
jgi:hypothetical protein